MAESSNGQIVRPVISLIAIMTLLETFGASIGGIITEVIVGYYKYPASNQLATYITAVCTVPLKIICIYYALKLGLMKIE